MLFLFHHPLVHLQNITLQPQVWWDTPGAPTIPALERQEDQELKV